MAIGLLFLGQLRLQQAILVGKNVLIVTRLLYCSRRNNGKKK